jgi:hypothetical protein
MLSCKSCGIAQCLAVGEQRVSSLDVASISTLPQDSCYSIIQAAMSTENATTDSTEVVFLCAGDKMTITKASHLSVLA